MAPRVRQAAGTSVQLRMMRARLLSLVFGLCLCALHGPAPARAAELLPVDQVRAGMTGVGRTVFEGTRVEEFGVEILGVLRNTGAGQSVVMARLSGPRLDRTGVAAGMSGSPVYVDGRLLGAVALGFPFSKETIAGITPIEEMLQATRAATPRPASARLAWPGRLVPALDRETLLGVLRGSAPAMLAMPTDWARLAGGAPAETLSPLPLPLTCAGVGTSAFESVRQALSGSAFAPVQWQADSGQSAASEPVPGAAVSLSLIQGDIDVSATGTITHVDSGQLYAFGHALYNLGPTRFPMRKAYVHAVLPSLYQSWKIASAAEVVGTFEQDRLTGVAGRLGSPPRMVPVEIDLTTSRGDARHYRLQVVDDELLTPGLVYLALLSTLQTSERALGAATMRVDARLSLAGRAEVRIEDLLAGQQPAQEAAAVVASPLVALVTNDFERVQIDKIAVRVLAQEADGRAALERAWLDRAGPYRSGTSLTLKLQLRTRRGQRVIRSADVALPAQLSPGRYTLAVMDADTTMRIDARDLRQPYAPRTLDQLLRVLNGLRRTSHVYIRLLRAEEGAVVAGEYMPALPPSVLSVLQTNPQANDVTNLRTASLVEIDVPTELAVDGARYLPIVIDR
jgi:hypothetical protein